MTGQPWLRAPLHAPPPPGLRAAMAAVLPDVLTLKYGPVAEQGWGPRLRASYDHATPDDWYEASLYTLVTPETRWLDVGCGRSLFASNPQTSRLLADRCKHLVGVDPDDNIDDNPFVHERIKLPIEQYRPDQMFDLVSMRMVAEHIADPPGALATLSRLVAPGGCVVVYTVAQRSPAALVAAVTPMAFHHFVKRILWGGEERDTFPTVYRMNTRANLTNVFQDYGFAEEHYLLLADCRITNRFPLLNRIELACERGLRRIGLPYPESCILAVYRKA